MRISDNVMSKITICLLFFSVRSFAVGITNVNYFKEFSAAFSYPTISDADFSKLSSYKLKPGLFIDFEKSPPDSFSDSDRHNSNVIFNGEVSKKYFISFINSDLISGGYLNEKAKKVFKDKNGDYSFEAKINKNQLVVFENMLILAPEGMTTEISCSYTFGPIHKEPLKLIDVVCAG